jgi:hypothetical protein
MRKHVLIILLFVYQVAATLGIADDRHKAISIFEKSIAGREAIKSAHCHLNVYRGGSNKESNLDIVFDADKIYIDKQEDGRQFYLWINCYTSNNIAVLELEPKIQPGFDSKIPSAAEGKMYPHSFLTLRNNKYIDPKESNWLYDDYANAFPNVKYMGQMLTRYLTPKGHLVTLDFALQTLKQQPISQIQITNETMGNDDLLKVSWRHHTIIDSTLLDELNNNAEKKISEEAFKKSREFQMSYYFDPQKNYIIRKVELKFILSGWGDVLNNEVKQDLQSKIWYPSHWVYESKEMDNVYKEEYDLEMTDINKPVSNSYFDMSSLKKLEVGTTVRWNMDSPPPAEGRLVWDGKKVVGISEYKFGIATGGRETSRHMFIILVNIAGISAIIAIQCLRVWRRRR